MVPLTDFGPASFLCPLPFQTKDLSLSHVNDAANAVSLFHLLECLIYVRQRFAVCYKLIDFELPVQVIVDKVW